MTELKVRTGTPDDIYGMMDLALAACAENGLTNPNPAKLAAEIWSALNLDRGIIGIIGELPTLEAAVLLRVESLWYSDTPSIIERAVFVNPNFRNAKGGRARLLCEFSKSTADSLNMPLVIGILSSDRAKSKVRLYERQFGEPSGAYWIYGARTGQWKDAAE